MNKWKKSKRLILNKKYLQEVSKKTIETKIDTINHGVEYYQKVEENKNNLDQ